MSAKNRLYWFLQVFGWNLYLILVGFSLYKSRGYSQQLLFFLLLVLVLNIFSSHFYRLLIKKKSWINDSFGVLSIKIIFSSILLGLVFSAITNFLSFLLFENVFVFIDLNSFLIGLFLYFVWNIIYFGYAYFDRSKNQEIERLKLTSEKNEIELQNLRSQLNPHFMFNSMNSIRALIDENPDKAKKAVTSLSAILRNALINTRDRLIPLKQEIETVQDYLSLEKIRYEERLTFNFDLAPTSLNILIPPMIIQTLAENAIKHGVAKKIAGGEVLIKSKLSDDNVIIQIINPGQLSNNSTQKDRPSLGILNTKRRLLMQYGDKASFSIKNLDADSVISTLTIPKS